MNRHKGAESVPKDQMVGLAGLTAQCSVPAGSATRFLSGFCRLQNAAVKPRACGKPSLTRKTKGRHPTSWMAAFGRVYTKVWGMR